MPTGISSGAGGSRGQDGRGGPGRFVRETGIRPASTGAAALAASSATQARSTSINTAFHALDTRAICELRPTYAIALSLL
jgi:hypothetical protein